METENIKTYGKFKSAEELLAAYNALEREFTKRCQRIKELQTAGEPACAQEEEKAAPSEEVTEHGTETAEQAIQSATDKAEEETSADDEAAEEPPTTKPDPAPTSPSTMWEEAAPSDIIGYVIANAEECAELLSEIPQVMDACIAKYKQRLISMGATVGAVRGAAVITPVRRPKTLSEAKMLADEMLR